MINKSMEQLNPDFLKNFRAWERKANEFIRHKYGVNWRVNVTETVRNLARQQQLFNMGRDKKGRIVDRRKVVTWTLDSRHRYKLAADWVLGNFKGVKCLKVEYGQEFYDAIYEAVPPENFGLHRLPIESPHLELVNSQNYIVKNGLKPL